MSRARKQHQEPAITRWRVQDARDGLFNLSLEDESLLPIVERLDEVLRLMPPEKVAG